jgi:uncharacterized peroxidase-related enzyme
MTKKYINFTTHNFLAEIREVAKMARIRMIKEEEATGRVKEVYQDIKACFGVVPNLFKAMALRPEILDANWNKTKAVLMSGIVSRETKEMIAVVVSKANSCDYCVNAHSTALKMLGFTEERIQKLLTNIGSADLDNKTKRILQFSINATRDPRRISEEEVKELKHMGISDGELLEIVSTMDMFTSYNKFLDTLSVEIESIGR